MEVWFYLTQEPRLRGQHTRRRSERTYTRAPPQRVGRAFALLTKTYHGSRETGNLKSTWTVTESSFDEDRCMFSLGGRMLRDHTERALSKESPAPSHSIESHRK